MVKRLHQRGMGQNCPKIVQMLYVLPLIYISKYVDRFRILVGILFSKYFLHISVLFMYVPMYLYARVSYAYKTDKNLHSLIFIQNFDLVIIQLPNLAIMCGTLSYTNDRSHDVEMHRTQFLFTKM